MSRSDQPDTNTDAHASTWLTPDQVEALRDAAYTEAVPTYLQDRNDALVALLYDTGLRRAEVAALDVDLLNLERREVQLPSRIQKGDPAPVTLDLGRWGADSTRALRRFLDRRWRDSPAVFPSRQADRMSPRSVSRAVTRLAEIAGVEPQDVDGGTGDPSDVTAHTLRHSVAFRIIREQGGRLEDVQLRLRHATRSTTDRVYSHLRAR